MSYCCAVRVVNVDFYMSQPLQEFDVKYADFRGVSISQVPVIRIFGSTDSGEKICMHVHGVFPYLYIPYDGCEDANILKYQIAVNIDKAINISFGQATSTTQHVYKIVLVSGIPFYGYHSRQHQFFKIYLFNPVLIRKVSNLLQSEVILGRLYQPHESHIPYILQFMIDYNVHGMSRVLLKSVKFRDDTPNSVAPKQSFCELEADTTGEEILNRLELNPENLGINPGIAALWEDEKQRLRDQGQDSEIGSCLTLEHLQVELSKSHLIYQQVLKEKLSMSEDSNDINDQSLSVYPAESPSDETIINSSVSEGNLSRSLSLNDTLDLNATFDQDAKDLFDILQDLGRKNLDTNEEIDSILSQVHKCDQDDDDDDDDVGDFFDLSMSIAETTPFKNINVDLSDDLDKTVVPQLDGQNDSDEDEEKYRSETSQKKKIRKKYGALPIFVNSPITNTSFPVKNENLEQIKRKLSFQNLGKDTIICDEKLECEYKVKNKENLFDSRKKRKLSSVDTKVEFVEKKVEECSHNEKAIDQLMIKPRNKPEVETAFTTAELYDFQTNYKAKEGCSTKLTQDSDSRSLSESAISLESHVSLMNLNKNETILISETNISQQLTSNRIKPLFKPPTRYEVVQTLESYKLPQVLQEKPFYSDPNDVTGSVEVGHNILQISSKTTLHLEDCKTYFCGIESYRKTKIPPNIKYNFDNIKKLKLSYCSGQTLKIVTIKKPPTRADVNKWLKSDYQKKKLNEKIARTEKMIIPNSPGCDISDIELTLTLSPEEITSSGCSSPILGKNNKKRPFTNDNSCQITGKTLDNTYGFKNTPENLQNAKAVNENQNLIIISMEIHVETRGDLKPDPEYDQVQGIFYSILDNRSEKISGIIGINVKHGDINCELTCVETEQELFEELVKLVSKWDPDIVIGYETELLSWGFLFERSKILGNELLLSLSRIKDKHVKSMVDDGLKITGRILLDFWRLLRHEIALQSYTFESVAYHLLQKRLPLYTFKNLSCWWKSSTLRHRTISYYLVRVKGTFEILDHLDLIGRTCELARLFGIQFFEVLSRGSQFRVESMMLRLAKPLNYIPVSPSVSQRAKMKAPEFLPLILEPESKLYVDPVIVLDFQSLYPSIIIAYNYCFSTCLGKVIHLGKITPFEFGATQLKISRARLKKFFDQDCLNFSPCGVAFVKKKIRDGILPRMLREILETRLMVKNSMKKNKDDRILQKVLHNRQLGLKLIANVTYGYTAANFSGRMPAVELADSVVSKGRETLQKAIDLVEKTPEWAARVVYGDTDSLFVLVPGKSRKEAFRIGKKIADAVTAANPDPIKLKLEKIYQPCILQTKKRYVGYMYESPDQLKPTYLAKGIETVRRDGCPAVAKMLEKCLRLLFETKDVTLVKQYVLRQFNKILTGRVSLQDLTFAKEYRGVSGYRPGACVPALELTRKWTAIDRRNEPRRGQRVPYVIVSGPPGVPLIRLVRSPYEFLNDSSLRPNAFYYITKVLIPPINRCFSLIGTDLNIWFNQMPRRNFQYLRNSSPLKKTTISQYFQANTCAVCLDQTQKSVCDKCVIKSQNSIVILNEKLRIWEGSFWDIRLICQSCTGIYEDKVCISLDCPILYKVNQTTRDLEQASYVREVINQLSSKSNISF